MKNNIVQFKYTKDEVRYMCDILERIRNKTPDRLFIEYDIDPLSIPVDLSKLVEKIGISTIAKDFTLLEKEQDVEEGTLIGAAISKGNDLAIFYKESDSLHRKKFTIAHELAHCCLDCPTNESNHIDYRIEPFVYNELYRPDELEKERRANIFAGNLLIPQKALEKVYKDMLIPSLSKLAEIFDVSVSVMAARLDHLKMPYYKDADIEIIL